MPDAPAGAERTPRRVSATEIARLDPYKFMATIGKRVIHPGGRASTGTLLRWAGITEATRVLDVGCGVATTAVEIARRFGSTVTAVDIAPLMLERAAVNVAAAGMSDRRSGRAHRVADRDRALRDDDRPRVPRR